MEIKCEVDYELFNEIRDKSTLKLYVEDGIKDFKTSMKIIFSCGEEGYVCFEVNNIDHSEGYLSLIKSKIDSVPETDKILESLANIIDRCDNALANIEFEEKELRAKLFEIAKIASIMYNMKKIDSVSIIKKAEKFLLVNPDIKILNELKSAGKFVYCDKLSEHFRNHPIMKLDELVQIAENSAIEIDECTIKLLNEIKEKGYAEICDLKHLDPIVKYFSKYFKIILVPKYFEYQPLQFKHYYKTKKSITNMEKIIYNFREIVKYIDIICKNLEGGSHLLEIFCELVKTHIEFGKLLDEPRLENEIDKLKALVNSI